MVPCLLIHAIPTTLISIVYLPHDIFYTYYTILSTAKIGRNIKALALLLLPIPLILWPVCVLVAYIVYGAGFGLFKPTKPTFDEKYNVFCGGIGEALTDSCKNVKEFHNFNANSYFTYLSDYRNYKLQPNEKPFDISFIELFIGLWIGTSGAIIDGVLFTILTVIKVIPALFKAYYELWKWFCKEFAKKCLDSCLKFVWTGLMFPIFLLGNAFIPFATVFVAVFMCLSGFFIGLSAGYVAYKEGIKKAFAKVYEWAKEYDEESNEAIYDKSFTCL